MGGEVVGRLEDFAVFGRLAGAEGCARFMQGILNLICERMRASERAPRGRLNLLERRHGLAEIVERGAFVIAERRRVIHHHI